MTYNVRRKITLWVPVGWWWCSWWRKSCWGIKAAPHH